MSDELQSPASAAPSTPPVSPASPAPPDAAPPVDAARVEGLDDRLTRLEGEMRVQTDAVRQMHAYLSAVAASQQPAAATKRPPAQAAAQVQAPAPAA